MSQPTLNSIVETLTIVLVISYPIAAHLSALYRYPYASWILLALLSLQAMQLLRKKKYLGGLICTGLALVLVWLLQQQAAQSIVFLTPVLIVSGLLMLFAGTLLPGNTALITRFAELTESKKLTPAIRRYTRRVTVCWVVLLAVMLLETVLLALFAPPWLWSLCTNGLNYVLILMALMVELRLRRRYAPQADVRTFRQFLLSLLQIDLRQLAGSARTPE